MLQGGVAGQRSGVAEKILLKILLKTKPKIYLRHT
jgi:hypothetical protein